MNRMACAATVVFLVMATSCPANELNSFEFVKTIDRGPGSATEDIVAVPFDSDIYVATQQQFADFRIVNDQAEVIPCKLQKVTEVKVKPVRRPSNGIIKALVEGEDNSIEVVVQLPDRTPRADGIILHTPLKNFERQVSVFGSNDGTSWQPLANNVMIFDYSRYMDVSNNEIALSGNEFRLLKAVIKRVVDQKESSLMELTRQFEDGKESQRTERTTVEKRPLRIDRISLWYLVPQTQSRTDKRVDYPIVAFDTEEVPKEKQSIVHVSTRCEPLTRFILETSSVNFSRHVVVQEPIVQGVNTKWVEIGNTNVSLFRFRGFDKEQLAVSFPERRQGEYRIVIDNQDNSPLTITGIRAQGVVYEALFFAAPKGKYDIYYHSDAATAPTYETAALDAVLAKDFQPVTAVLGPQTENPDFNASADFHFKKLMENRIVLGSVICLMIAVLAVLLVRASRRITD